MNFTRVKRWVLSLGVFVILAMLMPGKAYAGMPDCDLFAFNVLWNDGSVLDGEYNYSDTVVQRNKGAVSEGLIKPNEKLMVIDDSSFGAIITVNGKNASVSQIPYLTGIEEVASLTKEDFTLSAMINVSIFNDNFNYDKNGDQNGTIQLGSVYDVYTFNKRAYFVTSGRKTPPKYDDSKITFSSVYEVSVTKEGNGTASAASALKIPRESSTFGLKGGEIELKAVPDEGNVFKEWNVVSGNVTLKDAKSPETTFTIGEADVEVQAVFEEVSEPNPEKPEKKHKTIILSGLEKDGSSTELHLYYPEKTPSYNGKQHVWEGERLSARQQKKKEADLDIGVKGLPQTVSCDYKYNKNISASEEKAYYYIKLRLDKASPSFNGLNSTEKKNLKKAVRQANKLLKKKENRIYFTVRQLDLSDFIFNSAKSKRGKYVFERADGSGDTLTLRNNKYEFTDGFEEKKETKLELMASLSGNFFKISDKEYAKSLSGGTVTLTGKDKNLTGTVTGHMN